MSAEANAINDKVPTAESKTESGKQVKSDMCLVGAHGNSLAKERQLTGNAVIAVDGKSLDCQPVQYKTHQVRDRKWVSIDPGIDYVPADSVEACETKNYTPLRDSVSRASGDASALGSIAMYMSYVLDPGRPKLPARDIPEELKDKIPEGASDKQVTQICLTEANKYRQDLNQVLQTKGEANADWLAISNRVQKEINPGFDELVKLSQEGKFNQGNVLGKKAAEFANDHAETIDGDCYALMNKLVASDKHRVEECEENLPKPLEGVLDNLKLPMSQVADRADKLMMWLKPDLEKRTASLVYNWPMSLRRIKSESAYININCDILKQTMKTNVTLDNNGIDTDISKIEKPNISSIGKLEVDNGVAEHHQNIDLKTNSILFTLEKQSADSGAPSDQSTRDYINDKWKGLQAEVSGNVIDQNQQLQEMIKQLDAGKFDPVLAFKVWEKASVLKHVVPFVDAERLMLYDVAGDFRADEAKKKK